LLTNNQETQTDLNTNTVSTQASPNTAEFSSQCNIEQKKDFKA